MSHQLPVLDCIMWEQKHPKMPSLEPRLIFFHPLEPLARGSIASRRRIEARILYLRVGVCLAVLQCLCCRSSSLLSRVDFSSDCVGGCGRPARRLNPIWNRAGRAVRDRYFGLPICTSYVSTIDPRRPRLRRSRYCPRLRDIVASP
jgi:hypothetical protein